MAELSCSRPPGDSSGIDPFPGSRCSPCRSRGPPLSVANGRREGTGRVARSSSRPCTTTGPNCWPASAYHTTTWYDYLVIAVGSVSNDFGEPGVRSHCVFLDHREDAERFRQRLLAAEPLPAGFTCPDDRRFRRRESEDRHRRRRCHRRGDGRISSMTAREPGFCNPTESSTPPHPASPGPDGARSRTSAPASSPSGRPRRSPGSRTLRPGYTPR